MRTSTKKKKVIPYSRRIQHKQQAEQTCERASLNPLPLCTTSLYCSKRKTCIKSSTHAYIPAHKTTSYILPNRSEGFLANAFFLVLSPENQLRGCPIGGGVRVRVRCGGGGGQGTASGKVSRTKLIVDIAQQHMNRRIIHFSARNLPSPVITKSTKTKQP